MQKDDIFDLGYMLAINKLPSDEKILKEATLM